MLTDDKLLTALLSKRTSNVKSQCCNDNNNNSIHIIAIIGLICMTLSHQLTSVEGLLCYTCTYRESDMDNTCVMDANATQRITNCSKKYCTIVRQEAVSPAGKVISFIRDCLDKPLYLNAVKTDSTFKTFYRSCTTDLCNDSDGTHSATNVDPNFGASENTIIKGKRQ